MNSDQKIEVVYERSGEDLVLETNHFSPEDNQKIDEIVKQLNLNDSSLLFQFGAGIQRKIANFSEMALNNIRDKNLSEVSDVLHQVITELRTFTPSEPVRGFLGLFKKSAPSLSTMKRRFTKVEESIGEICILLEEHQIRLLKDVAIFNKMLESNIQYFKELSKYIEAGKRKLATTRNIDLQDLINRYERSGLPEHGEAVNYLRDLCHRFEKKIYDLELTRMISLQMSPQLRLLQVNNTLMVDKIRATLVNTIPLWRNQMVLALGLAHANDAMKAHHEITSRTNEILQGNAKALKRGSKKLSKGTKKGNLDTKTLEATNQKLIKILDEVAIIQVEGSKKREEVAGTMNEIEVKLQQQVEHISLP